MPLHVRRATKDDVDGIVELWKGFVAFLSPRDPRYAAQEGAYDKWREYFTNRMVNSEHAAMFVAVDEGKLVGVVECRIMGAHPVFKTGMHGQLFGHYVAKEYRAHGVGSELIEAAEAWMRAKKLPYYRVSVLSWLPDVKTAYEAAGMQHAEWIMEKRL